MLRSLITAVQIGLVCVLAAAVPAIASPELAAVTAATEEANLTLSAPEIDLGTVDPPDSFNILKVVVSNPGTTTIHNVTVTFTPEANKEIKFTLPETGDGCVARAKGTVCSLAELAPNATKTFEVKWVFLTGDISQVGHLLSTAVADEVSGTRTANTWVGDSGGDQTFFSFLHSPHIANITLQPEQQAAISVPLSVSGGSPTEGAFVAIDIYDRPEGLSATPPSGATCREWTLGNYTRLICYLPEVIQSGHTSNTWSAHNPFRMKATESVQPGTYYACLDFTPANTYYRNLGGGRDTWQIQPTVPLTVLVRSGGHEFCAHDYTVTITSGGSGNQEGGLPVTGAPAAALAVGGALLVICGAVTLLLVRRRRIVTVVD